MVRSSGPVGLALLPWSAGPVTNGAQGHGVAGGVDQIADNRAFLMCILGI
jgi:hypothetical protein